MAPRTLRLCGVEVYMATLSTTVRRLLQLSPLCKALAKHVASKQLGKELAAGRRGTALLGVHLEWHPASLALVRTLQAGRALTLCTGDLHEQQAQRQGERRGAHGVRHLQCGVLVTSTE